MKSSGCDLRKEENYSTEKSFEVLGVLVSSGVKGPRFRRNLKGRIPSWVSLDTFKKAGKTTASCGRSAH